MRKEEEEEVLNALIKYFKQNMYSSMKIIFKPNEKLSQFLSSANVIFLQYTSAYKFDCDSRFSYIG